MGNLLKQKEISIWVKSDFPRKYVDSQDEVFLSILNRDTPILARLLCLWQIP